MTIRLMRFLAIFAFGLAGIQGASAQTFVEATQPIVALPPSYSLINAVTEYGVDGSVVTRVGAHNPKGLKSLTVTFDAGKGAHVFTVNNGKPDPKRPSRYPTTLVYLVDQHVILPSDHYPVISADRTLTIKIHTVDATGQMGDTTYIVHALSSTLASNGPGLLSISTKGAQPAALFAGSMQIVPYPGDNNDMAVNGGVYTLVAVAPRTAMPSIENGCPPDSPVMLCKSVTVNAGSSTNPPAGTFYLTVRMVFDNYDPYHPQASFQATGVLTSATSSGGATSFIAIQPDTDAEKANNEIIPDPLLPNPVPPPEVGPLDYGMWTITMTSQQAGTITCTGNYGAGMDTGTMIRNGKADCH